MYYFFSILSVKHFQFQDILLEILPHIDKDFNRYGATGIKIKDSFFPPHMI